MRAVLTVLTVVVIALTGAGSVRAADPLTPSDRIGGRLSAAGSTVTILSTSTIPVRVTFDGDYATVEPATIILAPGQEATGTLRGPAKGDLSAHLTALSAPEAGDAASATLTLNLSPAQRPVDAPWGPIGLLTLCIVGLIVVGRRLRPWRWRIVST